MSLSAPSLPLPDTERGARTSPQKFSRRRGQTREPYGVEHLDRVISNPLPSLPLRVGEGDWTLSFKGKVAPRAGRGKDQQLTRMCTEKAISLPKCAFR